MGQRFLLQAIFKDYFMNADKLTQKQLTRIIDGAQDDIADRREKIKAVNGRIQKNRIYAQIKNREGIIKRANKILSKPWPGELATNIYA